MNYNIVWADDDVHSLYDTFTKTLFERNGINVLQTFVNAEELGHYIKKTKSRIDAVVVDANFPFREFKSNRERDVMGLTKVSQLVESYDFPFILYTGRIDLLNNEDRQEEFSYFTENKLIVQKSDGIKSLINKIQEEVCRRNSSKWIIMNQYEKELYCFEAFDKITGNGGAYDLILQLLVRSRENTLEHSEDYFNQIRAKVLDWMNSKAADFGIVPEGLSLNLFSRFLCHNKDKSLRYELNANVLPKALEPIMRYVVMLTQDASHGGREPEMQRYIKDNKDTLIIRSLLFATMELVVWFTTYLCDHTNKEENMKKWHEIDTTEEG